MVTKYQFFTTMQRVLVYFSEEIEVTKKTFRNYLTLLAKIGGSTCPLVPPPLLFLRPWKRVSKGSFTTSIPKWLLPLKIPKTKADFERIPFSHLSGNNAIHNKIFFFFSFLIQVYLIIKEWNFIFMDYKVLLFIAMRLETFWKNSLLFFKSILFLFNLWTYLSILFFKSYIKYKFCLEKMVS